MSEVLVTIPGLKLVSELNAHEHFRVRAKRAAAQNTLVGLILRTLKAPPAPCDVRIVRVATARLDTDNLQGSAKHVRDAVARWLGVDDRDPRVTWHVGQEVSRGPDSPAVRIVVRPWSLDAVGARATVEGDVVRVEAVLSAEQRVALARKLLDHPEVDLAIAGFRLTLHTVTTRTP